MRQSDVCRYRLPVQAFGKRNLPGAVGEGFGRSAPGKLKPDATREKRPRVDSVLEERILPVVRRGEHKEHMRRDGIEERQQSPDDIGAQSVGFVHDVGAARLRPERPERHLFGDIPDASGRHFRRVKFRHVEVGGLSKLFKWKKGAVEGGGMWQVFRDGLRLTCIPFDEVLRLERMNPDAPNNCTEWIYDEYESRMDLHRLTDELRMLFVE